jgi:hypothetical protein
MAIDEPVKGSKQPGEPDRGMMSDDMPSFRDERRRLTEDIARLGREYEAAHPVSLWDKIVLYTGGVFIWLACLAVLTGLALLLVLLIPEKPLRPPGWLCDEPGEQWKTAGCVPAPGYHFEKRGSGWAAVHDITHTPAARQRDLGISDAWEVLTNKQRQEILDGKATVNDFAEPIAK